MISPDTTSLDEDRTLPSALRFLAGGGSATRLILARDWSGHPLGPPQDWPEALKVSLSLVLNSPESMILAWGPEELTFFFNETYVPLLGPRLAWAMGAPFRQVWADAWDQAKPIIDEAFAGRSQHYVDLPWKLATDRGVADTWWSFSYSRVLDAAGAVAGLFIFTNETTERVRADALARASQQRLLLETERQRRSLQQMPGFTSILVGPDHVYEYVNDAYVTIAGSRDFIGRPIRDVFPELEGQGYFELLDQVYATGETFTTRAMPIRFAGEDEDRFIDFVYQPTRDDAGAVTGIFVGGYDVTGGVRAALALAQANATLEQRIAAALRERERAEDTLRQSQKMEAVGQLTGGLAHDFNNLLAGISGSLELIGTRAAQGRFGEVERYVAAGQGAARRAAALTHRLLAFSRRQTLAPKVTNVNQLVSGMAELIQRSVGPAINVETAGAPGLWLTLVDPPQLENALLNLCINARDAMPDGGSIIIGTANRRLDREAAQTHDMPEGEYLSLSVTDTGTGMAPEVIARAFEPFFTTKPMGQGTGLGLSMIYGFAKQSGGQVRIRSAVGEGTTVCIDLPRHHGEAEAADPPAAAGAVPRARRGETVMIVDDEPTVRMLVTDLLTDLGYASIEAAEAASALRMLQSGARVDLLITDVGLPGGMNGRQLAEAARELRPGLKVLFITGYAEHAFEPGTAVLTKPFAVEALAGRIRSMIAA